MADVSIRDLRNHGGEIVERAQRGESITITKSGKPVAKLVPIPRTPLSREDLVRRWSKLPPVDPAKLRRDIDSVINPSLWS